MTALLRAGSPLAPPLPVEVAVPPHRETAAVRAWVAANRARILADLAALVRIPSVSADPAARAAVRACAIELAGQLRRAGLADAHLVETQTHPLVVGTRRAPAGGRGLGGRPRRPTILVYGHYDVQPAGAIDAWTHPPFEATVDGDTLVGRGTADDKGQLAIHVAAIGALLATSGRLPVDVVAVADGAEEVGSPGLAGLLATPGPWQAVDAAIISDTRMAGSGHPALTASLRGLLSLDVQVRRPGVAVHAGHLGGALPDPLAALAGMIAALTSGGRVAVPGFYDAVRTLPRRRPVNATRRDAALVAATGSVPGLGEPGWTLEERTTIRPSLTVTGLAGGGVGAHAQATVATRARATLDIRLVPDQDPDAVHRLVRRRLAAACPPGIRVRTRARTRVRPVAIDLGQPVIGAARAALEDAFGRPPELLRSGGSSPVAAALQAAGIPVVLMGFALPDGHIHGADERLHLPTFFRGIVASADLLERLGSLGRPGGLGRTGGIGRS